MLCRVCCASVQRSIFSAPLLLPSHITQRYAPDGKARGKHTGEKTDIRQGTLPSVVLKTIEAQGPIHGYRIARRIGQTSQDLLTLDYGTLYPALLKPEQAGSIASA
jgi:hypothetical protein